MRRIINFIICVLIGSASVFAQSDSLSKVYQEHFFRLEQSLKNVKNENATLKQRIKVQEEKLKLQVVAWDSLKSAVTANADNIEITANQLGIKINETNASLQTKANAADLKSKTKWGLTLFIILLITSFVAYKLLHKRIKAGASSINEVHQAQELLQSVQHKMQEESIQLDNKLIELLGKQISSVSTVSTDHSLALKVADEITRIELNLSRMDASIKGYKQLSKAVQRIKDNFSANGYEIVDMLGKPYNAGMKAAVTFVTDDNLEKGKQIITKVIKPQINYKQQMIQAAQIEVSQSE